MSHQIRISAVELAAMTAVMVLAFAGSIGMPFNISAIAESFPIGNDGAGFVASAEMMAIALGTLSIGLLVTRFPLMGIYLTCLSVISAGNIASIFIGELWLLVPIRLACGLCLGAIVAAVTLTGARSERPESTFGVVNSAVGAMGILMGFVLPRALQLHVSLGLPTVVAGLFLTYAALAVLGFVFLRRVPLPPPILAEGGTRAEPLPLRRWVGLFGLGTLVFGHTLLGIFIVNLGKGIGMDAETIGYALMIGAVFGVAAPLLAGHFGTKVPAALWVSGVAVVITVFAFMLATAHSPTAFFLAAPLYSVLPMGVIPVMGGALARLDTSGRLAGASSAFILIGVALAPSLGGLLSAAGGFIVNAVGVVTCAVIGVALMWSDLRGADAVRGTVPAT